MGYICVIGVCVCSKNSGGPIDLSCQLFGTLRLSNMKWERGCWKTNRELSTLMERECRAHRLPVERIEIPQLLKQEISGATEVSTLACIAVLVAHALKGLPDRSCHADDKHAVPRALA